jgi:hypothetical protein
MDLQMYKFSSHNRHKFRTYGGVRGPPARFYIYLTQNNYEIICYLRFFRKFVVLKYCKLKNNGTINPTGRKSDAACVATE